MLTNQKRNLRGNANYAGSVRRYDILLLKFGFMGFGDRTRIIGTNKQLTSTSYVKL